MSRKDSPDFNDPKTLAAIALVLMIFVGWNYYMRQKYPEIGNPAEVTQTEQTQSDPSTPSPTKASADPVATDSQPNEAFSEEVINYESASMRTTISSKGLRIGRVVLKNHLDRETQNHAFGKNSDKVFEIRDVTGKPIPFQKISLAGNEITASSTLDYGVINAKMVFKGPYDFELNLYASNLTKDFEGFEVFGSKDPVGEVSSSFLMPSFETNEAYFLLADGQEERINLAEPSSASYPTASIFALNSQYFASAFVDSSPILPMVSMNSGPEAVNFSATYKPITRSDSFEINLRGYFGPKSTEQLAKVDERLKETINYGMFSFLAHPLLGLLKWFHALVGNWGLAIILMTIIVKLAVLPFNLMSYRSMKAMQKVQPQMASLREKFKDDPQRLNQEMMLLMKTHKVNPLGGCLPMLLQLPVFIALYQVLGQSIELYQAPFIGWITDLSLKDPFYVLPVLMGITMYFQMKMTPSTMDPTQAKVMAFMPVLFTLFMVSLPSGLTLYIFISTLFTVAQQLFFMREKGQDPLPQGAKA